MQRSFPFKCVFVYLGFVHVNIFSLHMQSHLIYSHGDFLFHSPYIFNILLALFRFVNFYAKGLNVWDYFGLFSIGSTHLDPFVDLFGLSFNSVMGGFLFFFFPDSFLLVWFSLLGKKLVASMSQSLWFIQSVLLSVEETKVIPFVVLFLHSIDKSSCCFKMSSISYFFISFWLV